MTGSVDPDIHDIWKEMRWPGHVKARHFVLALRDYYRQQVDSKRKAADVDAAVRRVADQDEWALQWIAINRLQAIAEAFDDDASGFITIAEVNHFTASRPKEWSLPHWLAYWAIGWQMTATKYQGMITSICAKMFAIRSQVLPANRHAVDKYLQTVWKNISILGNSRLREGLETVKYDIDAMDTLLLVTGPGRIEKPLFPLLWLLLRRDFEIFRLCRKTVIHKDELWDSSDTLLWVFKAVTERHDDLAALFKQQKLDPGLQFKTFASEAFNLWHDSKKFWSLDNLRTLNFAEVEYDDSEEDQNVDVSKLLNYPSASDDLYPPPVEDPITENDAAADEAIRLILGRWNGIEVEDGEISPMMTFCLRASMDHKTCEARAPCATGTDYNLLGDYTTKDDGTVEYTFTQTYLARISKTYWTGTLSDDGETFSGKWGYEKDDQPDAFVYKRVPPEVLIDRPHPNEFTENRVKALWKYALTAVRNQVRRRLFSWSYLKERRDVRKEYLELLLKEMDDQLTDADMERFSVLDHRSTFDDVRCFYVLRDYRQRAVPVHFPIYGTRMVCMECGSRFTFDFCDKPACVGCTIKTRDDVTSPHRPTHDFVKIRTPILHYREIGKVLRNAKAGLERAKTLLEKAETQKKRREEAEKPAGNHEETKPRDGKDGEAPVSLPKKKITPGRPETTESSDSDSENEVVALACLKCDAPVSRPCLYCIDCPNDPKPFICWACDEKEAGFSHGEHHLATHNLVRCMEAQKEEESKSSKDDKTEKRLDALEHKLEGVTSQMEGLTSRMDGLTSQMEGLTGQMERIETLLQSFAIVRAE
ncbi:hypothetical protein LXA43DRAFT_1100597 [Ganoderma leucocontextum]|nr:hypothetical protein LXA43DRAFT_1100597 [Ganoderma leucocontextum]